MAAPDPVRTPELAAWCGALSYLVRRLLENPDQIVIRRATQVLREYDAEIEAWKAELDAFVTPLAPEVGASSAVTVEASGVGNEPGTGAGASNGRRCDSLTAYRERQLETRKLG